MRISHYHDNIRLETFLHELRGVSFPVIMFFFSTSTSLWVYFHFNLYNPPLPSTQEIGTSWTSLNLTHIPRFNLFIVPTFFLHYWTFTIQNTLLVGQSRNFRVSNLRFYQLRYRYSDNSDPICRKEGYKGRKRRIQREKTHYFFTNYVLPSETTTWF